MPLLLLAQGFATSQFGRLCIAAVVIVSIAIVVNIAVGEQIPPKVKQIVTVLLVAALVVFAIYFLISLL